MGNLRRRLQRKNGRGGPARRSPHELACVMRVRGLDARYALWGMGLVLLAAIPALAGFVSLGWELSQMAGLASGLACIALCGAPVRPRNSVPPTLLSLQLHQLIGWGALIAAAVHIGGLVLADRIAVEYLKPTTPLYQLAGILASLLLLIMVVSSVAAYDVVSGRVTEVSRPRTSFSAASSPRRSPCTLS